jgi:hypothetical protein
VNILAFDLETIPLASSAATCSSAGTAEQPTELYEKDCREASTRPYRGRILAAGWASVAKSGALYAETEAEEAALIETLWRYLDKAELILTFNGQSFDLPFLRARSWILGVPIPVPARRMGAWLKKFGHYGGHVDLRGALSHWGYGAEGAGTLDDWLGAFGVEGKPMSGAEVYPAFLRGEHARIQAYAASDAAALLPIWATVGPSLEVSLR